MATEQKPDIERLVWPKDAHTFQWIDRAKAIMDFVTRAGTMYLGYQAFEKVVPGAGLSGVIVSQIAMKLAQSNNMAGGVAGVATLTGMGILNVVDLENETSNAVSLWNWINLLHPVTWGQALKETLTP